jgi:hypothetical protein
MSQAPSLRAKPRSSVVGQLVLSPELIAGLPVCSARVCGAALAPFRPKVPASSGLLVKLLAVIEQLPCASLFITRS